MTADPPFAQRRPLDPVRPHAAIGWDEPVDLSKDPAFVPDLAETPVPDELREEIERAMAKFPRRHSAVLLALTAAQNHHGYVSPEAVQQVAAVMRVTPGYLSSIATFYDMLKTAPLGRHDVHVCTSVACHPRNARAIYEAVKEAASDLEDTEIREVECQGACDMAPMASVDGRYIGPLDPSDAPEIVAAVREGRIPLPGRGLEDVDFELPANGGATSGGSPENQPEGAPPQGAPPESPPEGGAS